MNVELTIAGGLCLVLAFGHETIGLVWVLPKLTKEGLPSTPFGSRSMTLAMLRVTWHVVTIFALALSILLLTLGLAPDADPQTLLLYSFAAMWLVATVMALWVAGRGMGSLRGLLRLPVPVLFLVVAVLLWLAST